MLQGAGPKWGGVVEPLQKSRPSMQVWVAERYVLGFQAFNLQRLRQARFQQDRNVFLFAYKVFRFGFCVFITPKSWILRKRILKIGNSPFYWKLVSVSGLMALSV